MPSRKEKMRAKMNIDWNVKAPTKPDLDRFQKYLRDQGFRPVTIEGYLDFVGRYLDSGKTVSEFMDRLHNRHLARSSINSYISAIKAYHRMLGEPLDDLRILRQPEGIPYYFDEEDIRKIFGVVQNLKHQAILYLLFYACLRASELCSLNVEDIDLQKLTVRIREGKGGWPGIVGFSNDCGAMIKSYLDFRPPLKIDGEMPLFYTDYGDRWDRKGLYKMFIKYKKKAGIQKKGGLHVFGRHSPATLMVANGCDIRIVQEVLRHNDIRTTLRYAHVSDKTKREKYEQFLKL
jgi:integrase/recombinase XerD